jgi:alkylation response protein AidB-like acyl-CoA dehydrogenase
MQRSLFDADHDAFRDSVREFVTRYLEPNEEKFIEQRYIDREIWLQAGANGYLGLEVPEQYGGSGR